MVKIINPKSLAVPKGYNHGVLANGFLFIAGQIAWDKDCRIVSDDFVKQFEKALSNVLEVAKAAGSGPDKIVQMNIFVKDKNEYLTKAKEIGKVYRSLAGKHFPAMCLLEVKDLLEEGAKVEIQAIAAV